MALSVASYPLSEVSDKEHNYRELRVWKKSVEFADRIYKTTKNFPKDEIFALSSQLKRAAVSVASNIAEGSVKNSNKDFVRYLHIASGSLAEIDTQLAIAELQNFISADEVKRLYAELIDLRKMIAGLKRSILKKSDNK